MTIESRRYQIDASTRVTIAGAIAAILIVATEAQTQLAERICGDADGNGAVTASDGVQILRAAGNLSSTCAPNDPRCDVDGDGRITISDGVNTLRLAAELFTAGRCVASAPRALVNGSETMAREDVALPGCEDVTTEGRYCLTMTPDTETSSWAIGVLGLESGRLCTLQHLDASLSFWDQASSLAWRGEILYACAFDFSACEADPDACPRSSLVRISVLDGTWEAAGIPCQGIAADDASLFAMRWPVDPAEESRG